VGASVKVSIPLLAECGFSANLCPDAGCALEMLNERRYQVVLCGLDLPATKGMKLLNLVCEEFPEVAVVIVTKPSNLHRAMMAVISGASGYIRLHFGS
jgi:DNA-binding NtrC family response regulator